MDIWEENIVNAPQWIDFTNSPHISDDFFDKPREGNTPLSHIKHLKQESTLNTMEKVPLSSIRTNENEFIGELEKVKMTPIKIVSPNGKDKENMMVVKETTYEDFLQKAMNGLQLNAKRSTRKTLQITSSFCESSNETYHTPSAVITRSIAAQMRAGSVKKLEFDSCDNTDNLPKSAKKAVKNKSVKENVDANKEIQNSKEDNKNKKTSVLEDLPKAPDVQVDKEKISSKIVTSFGNKLVTSMIPQNVKKVPPHRVLPYQNRRLSFRKPLKSKTQKYVSLAEAVSKFQSGTPKRFRTVSSKDPNPGPVLKVKQSALQLTRAVSPALRSKSRTRPVTVLSREEREKLELEEIRSHPIKANPVKMSTLKKAEPLKKIEKKPITIPEPFHLTEVKKTQTVPQSANKSNDMTINKKIALAKKNAMSTTMMMQATTTMATPSTAHHQSANVTLNTKNKVQMVVGADDAGITVKEVEVLHFGIPIKQANKTKITSAMPFSFEKRAKEFLAKKEQKLKHLQEEETKKLKAEFHARPAPSFNKSSSISHHGSKENVTPKPKTTMCPFSFEQRDKMLMKKKEELVKQALEEEKKGRIFHAKPVPTFKPILVRGLSRENLKTEKKKDAAPQMKKNVPLKAVHHVQKSVQLQQKVSKAAKPKVTAFELSTDKRAKERREFDEKMRQKELEEEELRQKEEEEQAAKIKAENEMIRKTMEIKARPMPDFKPLAILKSEKPLTDPQSPAWSRKKL